LSYSDTQENPGFYGTPGLGQCGLSKLAQAVMLVFLALSIMIARTFFVISSILAGRYQQRTSNYTILHILWFIIH
jgi:hypothetical protein